MSWPTISRYTSFRRAVALTSAVDCQYRAATAGLGGKGAPMSWLRTSARHSFRQFWMYSFSLPLWFRSPRMRS